MPMKTRDIKALFSRSARAHNVQYWSSTFLAARKSSPHARNSSFFAVLALHSLLAVALLGAP